MVLDWRREGEGHSSFLALASFGKFSGEGEGERRSFLLGSSKDSQGSFMLTFSVVNIEEYRDLHMILFVYYAGWGLRNGKPGGNRVGGVEEEREREGGKGRNKEGKYGRHSCHELLLHIFVGTTVVAMQTLQGESKVGVEKIPYCSCLLSGSSFAVECYACVARPLLYLLSHPRMRVILSPVHAHMLLASLEYFLCFYPPMFLFSRFVVLCAVGLVVVGGREDAVPACTKPVSDGDKFKVPALKFYACVMLPLADEYCV